MKKRDYETSAILVRMPLDMRAWLVRKADRSTASLSAEAVRALRDVMDLEHEQAREQRRVRK